MIFEIRIPSEKYFTETYSTVSNVRIFQGVRAMSKKKSIGINQK